MTSEAADNCDKFLWDSGRNREYDNAKEDIGDAKLVDKTGSSMGENVAAKNESEKAERKESYMVKKAVVGTVGWTQGRGWRR